MFEDLKDCICWSMGLSGWNGQRYQSRLKAGRGPIRKNLEGWVAELRFVLKVIGRWCLSLSRRSAQLDWLTEGNPSCAGEKGL